MKIAEFPPDEIVSKNRKLVKKMVRIIASCETKEHIERVSKVLSAFYLRYNDNMLNQTLRVLLYYHEYNLSNKI